MFIGHTLHYGMDLLTPWMPKPANHAYFSVQLIAVSNTSVDLEFQVQHKNIETTAVWRTGGSGLSRHRHSPSRCG